MWFILKKSHEWVKVHSQLCQNETINGFISISFKQCHQTDNGLNHIPSHIEMKPSKLSFCCDTPTFNAKYNKNLNCFRFCRKMGWQTVFLDTPSGQQSQNSLIFLSSFSDHTQKENVRKDFDHVGKQPKN